jgi:hypothetical protein
MSRLALLLKGVCSCCYKLLIAPAGSFYFFFPFQLYASCMSTRLALLLKGWIYMVCFSYLICSFYQREMNNHCNFVDVT